MKPAPSYSRPHLGLVWEWNPEYNTLTLKNILEAAKKEFPDWRPEDIVIRVPIDRFCRMQLMLGVG